MVEGCKHQQVRIVSRNDDAEFVECVQCGEVFDAEEFEDMRIEESIEHAHDKDGAEEEKEQA